MKAKYMLYIQKNESVNYYTRLVNCPRIYSKRIKEINILIKNIKGIHDNCKKSTVHTGLRRVVIGKANSQRSSGRIFWVVGT